MYSLRDSSVYDSSLSQALDTLASTMYDGCGADADADRGGTDTRSDRTRKVYGIDTAVRIRKIEQMMKDQQAPKG